MWKYSIPIALTVLLTSCHLAAPQNDMAKGEQVVRDFYGLLAAGHYEEAADLYGGDYGALVAANPEVPAEERAALWQAACEVNGYQCLPVLDVLTLEAISMKELVLTVTYHTKDGNAFMLGSCCGVSEAEMPLVSEFEVHVFRQGQDYRITSPPPYVP